MGKASVGSARRYTLLHYQVVKQSRDCALCDNLEPVIAVAISGEALPGRSSHRLRGRAFHHARRLGSSPPLRRRAPSSCRRLALLSGGAGPRGAGSTLGVAAAFSVTANSSCPSRVPASQITLSSGSFPTAHTTIRRRQP